MNEQHGAEHVVTNVGIQQIGVKQCATAKNNETSKPSEMKRGCVIA
jgi:hypothetical protein